MKASFSLIFLVVVVVVFLVVGVGVINAFVAVVPTSRNIRSSSSLDKKSCCCLESNNDAEEEWRAFRARLVQNGLPSLENNRTDSTTSSNKNQHYAHITTPLVEIGSILLSLPTTDLCQALDQQYWHRSVVLITNVTDNIVNGELIDYNEVPKDQLANGDKKGRWSYRGLILNRCTDMLYVDSDNNDDRGSWRVHRGGDLLGLDSSEGTDCTCLYMHSKNEEVSSSRLVGNLSYMKLNDAQSLCKDHPTIYNPRDFILFGGFCSWRPGQLEREMGIERQEWVVLSVDENTIWDELSSEFGIGEGTDRYHQQNEDALFNDLLEVGTNMWRNYLAKVDISEEKATQRLPSGQLDFYDQMLNVWAEDNLNVNSKEDTKPAARSCAIDSSDDIGPGTLVRATSPPTNDMLLYEQEFIRSIILVLEDTTEATVGIVLNHLMPAAIECKEDDDPLPLRYGGPIDVPSWRYRTYRDEHEEVKEKEEGEEEEEEEEFYDGFLDFQKSGTIDDIIFDDAYDNDEVYDDDSSFIWIHRDVALGAGQDNGGGSRLGTSDVWLINEDDALKAIQLGSLCLIDTMVFSGVSIWEKGSDLGVCGGGLREQIDSLHSFEVVRVCNDHSDCDNDDVIESVWDTLSKQQQQLVKDSLKSNVDAIIAAWEACSHKSNQQPVDDDNVTRARIHLGDAALKAWIGRSLLEDPLGTHVEVGSDQREELFE